MVINYRPESGISPKHYSEISNIKHGSNFILKELYFETSPEFISYSVGGFLWRSSTRQRRNNKLTTKSLPPYGSEVQRKASI